MTGNKKPNSAEIYVRFEDGCKFELNFQTPAGYEITYDVLPRQHDHSSFLIQRVVDNQEKTIESHTPTKCKKSRKLQNEQQMAVILFDFECDTHNHSKYSNVVENVAQNCEESLLGDLQEIAAGE